MLHLVSVQLNTMRSWFASRVCKLYIQERGDESRRKLHIALTAVFSAEKDNWGGIMLFEDNNVKYGLSIMQFGPQM